MFSFGFFLTFYELPIFRRSANRCWQTLAVQAQGLTDLFAARGGHQLVEYGDLRRLAGESPQKIVWLDDPAPTTARLARARESYHGQLAVLISSPEYLEFTAAGVNKAAGLEVVGKYYGVAPSEVLAFGDGNNDVEMFRWAGAGVAMSHATPQARAAATFIAAPGDPSTSFARAVAKLRMNPPNRPAALASKWPMRIKSAVL